MAILQAAVAVFSLLIQVCLGASQFSFLVQAAGGRDVPLGLQFRLILGARVVGGLGNVEQLARSACAR